MFANASSRVHARKLERDAAVADEQHTPRGVQPRSERAHVVGVAQLKHGVRSGAPQRPRPRARGDAQAVIGKHTVFPVRRDDTKHLSARPC